MTREGRPAGTPGPGATTGSGGGRRAEVDLGWQDTTTGRDATEGGDIAVTRLRPGGRPPVLVAVLLAGIVAVALVKPWGGGERAAGPAAPEVPADTTRNLPAAGATAPPAAEAAMREHCLDPGGWRVFAHEGTGEGTIRSWKSVVPATGPHRPDDGAIPVVPVGAPELEGLGYCAPWRGDERPPGGVTLSVWSLATDGAARPVETRRVVPPVRNPLGGLFVPAVTGPAEAASGAPPGSSAHGARAGAVDWPDGRYVFALQARGYERWWRVDVVTGRPPAAGPDRTSPSPGATAPG